MYLDPAARDTPVVALGAAAREALRLADVLDAMMSGLREALVKGDRRQIAETKRLGDVLDKLNDAIKSYVTTIDPDALSDADHRRVREVLAFSINMEHAGEIKRGVSFSKAGEAELLAMIDRLQANVRTAASSFMTGDERAARLLAAEKEIFRDLESEATDAHFSRLRARRIDTAETSTMHLDALRDLKNVNTHLVAAAAYPVLENTGELLRSRIRQDGDTPASYPAGGPNSA
jgi:phosphate:Na+ symporter